MTVWQNCWLSSICFFFISQISSPDLSHFFPSWEGSEEVFSFFTFCNLLLFAIRGSKTWKKNWQSTQENWNSIQFSLTFYHGNNWLSNNCNCIKDHLFNSDISVFLNNLINKQTNDTLNLILTIWHANFKSYQS